MLLRRVKGQVRSRPTGKTRPLTTDPNAKTNSQNRRRNKKKIRSPAWPWKWSKYDDPKRREPLIRWQGITSQNRCYLIARCLCSVFAAFEAHHNGIHHNRFYRHNVRPVAQLASSKRFCVFIYCKFLRLECYLPTRDLKDVRWRSGERVWKPTGDITTATLSEQSRSWKENYE